MPIQFHYYDFDTQYSTSSCHYDKIDDTEQNL